MAQLINETKRMQQLAGLVNESQLEEAFSDTVSEYTNSTEKTLKSNGFTIKPYFNGDMHQGTIAIDNRIVGYYAQKPEAADYPLKKGDALFGKPVIWATSTGNELDKIIKESAQPQQESIEQAVNEALAKFRKTGK